MNCELCGKPIDRYYEVVIDGVKMNVCHDCAKFGKEITKKTITVQGEHTPLNLPKQRMISVLSPPPRQPRRRASDNTDDLEEPILDFGKVIKKRREEMGLSQEELANKLQEKRNLIAKIEREEIKPNREIGRKIEKLMGIRILEKIQ
jgi:putative transcription factor